MRHILIIAYLLFFSSIFISCGEKDESTDDTTTTDTTAPTVSSISPTENQSGVSNSDNFSVTFSEAMDTTSVTTNTSNTTCSGSLELSSDSFSTCVKMSSSPSVSNSDKTFTVDPSENLQLSTTYKIRVTTGVKDSSGNTLSSQYETSNGFTTFDTSCENSSCVITLTVVGSNGDVCVELNKWSGCSSGDTTYTQGIHSITVTVGDSIGFEFNTNSGYSRKFTDPDGNVSTSSSGTHRGPQYSNVRENISIKVEFF